MRLFELLETNLDAVKSVGDRAIAAARRDGVSAYYMDPALGAGIVRELPDGTRERFYRSAGQRIVVARYGPRS